MNSIPADETPTPELLAQAVRCLRAFRLRTLDHTAIGSPEEGSAYLAELAPLLAALPPALTQMAEAFTEQGHELVLTTPPDSTLNASELIAAVTLSLTEATRCTHDAALMLTHAHRAVKGAHDFAQRIKSDDSLTD